MNAALFLSSLAWALLDFVWQGVLVGCAAAALLGLLGRARPQLRYALACAALLLCAALPLAGLLARLADLDAAPAALPALSTVVNFTLAGGTADGASPAAGATVLGLQEALRARLPLLILCWAGGAGLLALRMLLGLAWVRRRSRPGAYRVDPSWQAALDRLAARMGLARRVVFGLVDDLTSPVTAGWWRPVVLVPAALVSGMSPQLLEALLAHELGHVRRHDYLVNLVQNLIETLLFYHPAVWWISHRIRIEREQIADDYAAHHLGEPRRLALALSELERLQFSGHHLAQAANGGDLMARIRRLLRPSRQALDWTAALPVLGLALACAASAHAFRPALVATAAPTLSAGAGMLREVSTRPLADFSSCAKPEYPKPDLGAGHQGTTTLQFMVGADGAVLNSRVARSSGHPGLDDAALTALARCRFTPALAHGRPVQASTAVKYVWTLE